jgi:small subunit ribosomal protein S27e
MKKQVRNPKSKFLKIRCEKCKNEQIVFERSSRDIHCLICNETLGKSSGGKLKLNVRVMEVLE